MREDGFHEILRNDCIQDFVMVETRTEILKGCIIITEHYSYIMNFGISSDSVLYLLLYKMIDDHFYTKTHCKIVVRQWRDAAD